MMTDTLSVTDTELEEMLGDSLDMYIVFGPLRGKVVSTETNGNVTTFVSEVLKCTGEPLVGGLYVVTSSGERLNWKLKTETFTQGKTWSGHSIEVTLNLSY